MYSATLAILVFSLGNPQDFQKVYIYINKHTYRHIYIMYIHEYVLRHTSYSSILYGKSQDSNTYTYI